MKKILTISTAIVSVMLLMSSCKKSLNDFLEKAPGVDINEDIVFSTKVNVDAYVSTMYQYGLFSLLPSRTAAIISNPSNGSSPTQIGTINAATDEGKNAATFQFSNIWNSATVTSSNIISAEDYRYHARFKVIRMVSILLERIDAVNDPAADTVYKKGVKAQAKFFRALQNFEMLKRYGGFPLVTKRFADVDSSKLPRSTFEECVNYILKDCDEAFPDVEVVYSAAQRGRITKLAVLALKARTLLFAASPIFNTGTPVLSMADPVNNKYICYGNYDKNRWKLAADASKAVLDFASQSGAALVDVASLAARNPTTNFLVGNYRVSWESQDNTEIILADKSSTDAGNNFSFPWQHLMPGGLMQGFYGGTSVLLNFMKKYEDTLGNVVSWPDAGGNDLSAKYASLDSRFKQSVGYNGARWNSVNPIVETFVGGKHAAQCFGGQWMLKPLPEGIATGSVVPSLPMFRLNEFYLNYAEAMNEFSGPGTSPAVIDVSTLALKNAYRATYNYPLVPANIYDCINKLRLRSGMFPLPVNLSQDQFRARVRNERAIELAFEDHRFWDIRRWLIAEDDGVMKGDMYGLTINRINATTFSYLPYKIETRSFNKNMYLHPFDITEVQKSNLIQNPGW